MLRASFDKGGRTRSVKGAQQLAKINDGAIYGFGNLRIHVEHGNEFRFGVHGSGLELRISPKFYGGFRAGMYQHVDARPSPTQVNWHGKNARLDKVFSERAAAVNSIHKAVEKSSVLPSEKRDLLKAQVIDSDPAIYRVADYSLHVDNEYQLQFGRQMQLGVQGVVQFFR